MKDVNDLHQRVTSLLRQTLDALVTSGGALVQHTETLLDGADGPLTRDQQVFVKRILKSGQKIAHIAEVTERAFMKVEIHSADVQPSRAKTEERLDSLFEILQGLGSELRMPITSISGYSKLLQSDEVDGPLTAVQAQRIGHITSLGQELLAACSKAIEVGRSLWMERKV